jgi:hypothetical protein
MAGNIPTIIYTNEYYYYDSSSLARWFLPPASSAIMNEIQRQGYAPSQPRGRENGADRAIVDESQSN